MKKITIISGLAVFAFSSAVAADPPSPACNECPPNSVTYEHDDFQWAFVQKDQDAIIQGFLAGQALDGTMPNGTPFYFEAIHRNLARVVRHMIESGLEPLRWDKDGNTALQAAARAKAEDVISLLLATGKFDVNAPNPEGYAPLWYAVTDSPEAVEVLLQAGADPNLPTNDQYQVAPLVRAASTGHASSIPPLLEAGANIEGEAGFAAVRAASYFETEGNLEAIRILGKSGAPMHAERSSNDPLMRAISDKKYKMIEVLLASGANVNRTFENSTTPIMRALSFSNDPKALRILLRHHPDLDHFATFPVSRKGVFLGAEDNSPDHVTRTALMSAAAEGKLEMVRLLLEAGATANLKNNLGETALDLAIRGGHTKVTELFRNFP